LSHTSSSFCSGYFAIGSHFFVWTILDHDLPSLSFSVISGVTGMPHHTKLPYLHPLPLSEMDFHAFFFFAQIELDPSTCLPISASQVGSQAGVTSTWYNPLFDEIKMS
jgi:hypothetical protein